MNIISGLKLSLTALFLLSMPASASTLTLDFDQFGDPDVPLSGDQAGAPVGPIGFINANHGIYDTFLPSILLGDDGWDTSISFDAREGYLFDALSLRFVSGHKNVYSAPLSAAVSPTSEYYQLQEAKRVGSLVQSDFPYVTFSGYRDGAMVAMQTATFDGLPNVTKTFANGFVNLDRLVVALDFGFASGLEPLIFGDRLYYCPNERCGLLKFDDLLLDVRPLNGGTIAAVPLPAPILMLTTALLGISAFAQRPPTNPST